MLETTRKAIIDSLAVRGQAGATAKELGAELGWKPNHACQRMAQLFFAGELDRENIEAGKGRAEYRYRLKPPKVEAPATQWRPEQTRIAERFTALPTTAEQSAET